MNILSIAPLEVAQFALVILGAGLVALVILGLKKLSDPWFEKMAEKSRQEQERALEAYRKWQEEAPEREARERERIESEKARLAALPPAAPASGLWLGGWTLLVVGILAALYFLAVYDVSVQAGSVRVVNAARLQDRLAGIIISVVIAFSGGLCMIADQLKSTSPKETSASPSASPSAPLEEL